MGTPRKNPDSIESILCDIRNWGKVDTKYARELLIKLTGKDDWTEQQCKQVYESILRHYLDDDKSLNLMLDVSGLSQGYQSIKTISKRREKYLDEHNDKRGSDSLAKNEELHCLQYIARKLQEAVEDGTILDLVEKWTSEENNKEDTQTDNPKQHSQDNAVPFVQHNTYNGCAFNLGEIDGNNIANSGNIDEVTIMDGEQDNVQTEPESKPKSQDGLLKKVAELLLEWIKNNLFIVLCILFSIGIMALNALRISKPFDSGTSQISAISVSQEEVILKPGETYTIRPTTVPETAINTKLNYTSPYTNIAAVQKTKGVVLAQDNWEGEDVQTVDIAIRADNDIETSKSITVKRLKKGNPVEATIQTKVRKVDPIDNGWENIVEAEIGDVIEFQITYENKSNLNQNHVIIRDILPVNLEYITGSTKLWNGVCPDGIVDNGIDIGSYIPGANASICFRAKIIDTKLTPGVNTVVNRVSMDKKILSQEYAAVIIECVPDYTLQVSLRFAGTKGKNWTDVLEVNVGDEVECQIAYQNTSDETQYNVILRDYLPNNMEYIAGSTRIWNDLHEGDTYDSDRLFTNNGIHIGSYGPGANAYVRFNARVINKDLTEGSNTLVNLGQAWVGENVVQDYANMTLFY